MRAEHPVPGAIAGVLDVFVPADRHRLKVRQVADDGFGGVHQFGGELAVRDHDNGNRYYITGHRYNDFLRRRYSIADGSRGFELQLV